LKKQNQFLKGEMSISINMKRCYEELYAFWLAKKQNQSFNFAQRLPRGPSGLAMTFVSPLFRALVALWLIANLKKQSQFTTAQMGLKSFEKGDYGNKPAAGVEKNKANQSQFMYRWAGSSLIITLTTDAGYSMLVGYRETRNEKRNYD
jgi:hypothetical protein